MQHVEMYAKQMMTAEIAHDFKHADRVRKWAVQIAPQEAYDNVEIVEIAALLHDIGYTKTRRFHAQMGAQMAARFLRDCKLFSDQEIEAITHAIRYHNTPRGGKGKLTDIVRDADMLDMFGAIGVMRAWTSKASQPEYNPRNVKGDTWGITAQEIDQRFAEGKGTGEYIVDQINFQISCYDNLMTETAKKFAKPLVEFMKQYMLQLEFEVTEVFSE